MSLAPLLDAAPAIPLHAFAAMAAFALGLVQFAAPKGTLPHRTVGWIWVGLMAIVACVSFLAPYAWVAWAGRDGEFPTAVYITIAVLVVCLGTNAVVGIAKRVRSAKVESVPVDHVVGVP